jgi:cytochrome c oxidase cbb3-type subunit 3
VSCHGVNGEGKIGPNLTDSYWLHGGTINDVFKTIKYGVPEKSMPTWSKIFPASKIKDVASYVKSIAGTNPANAKSPDGELFQEATTQNSAAKKDSVIGGKK